MASYKGISTKDNLEHYLDKAGIEYNSEDLTNPERVELLAENEVEIDGSHEDNAEDSGDESESSDSGKVYYWLKTESYVDEERTLPAGLYYMEPNERLERSPDSAVEKLGDELNDRQLVEVAESYGYKIDAGDEVDADLEDELLKDAENYSHEP